MSDTDTTDRLVHRLHHAAYELASAARMGLAVPATVSVVGHDNMDGLALSLATVDDFDAWADYAADVTAEEYDHDGRHWHRATGTLGLDGLRVTFAVPTPLADEVAA
jgi:hypothetical protein